MGQFIEQRAGEIVITGSSNNGKSESLKPSGAAFWGAADEDITWFSLENFVN